MNLLIKVLLVSLQGFLRANCSPREDKLINQLFGNLIENHFPIKDIYFTLRPEGAAKDSTLYRFNLTYGELTDIGDRFTPKDDVCNAECKKGELNAACHFDLKGATISYYGQMSYGSKVVQTFKLYAYISEFPFGDHYNPADISTIFVSVPGSNIPKGDLRKCLITNFVLTSVTFPPFWEFPQFKKNHTLAAAVWSEFEVRMFTDVRVTVMKTIPEKCRTELYKKNVTCS